MKISGKELKMALKMAELTQEIAADRLGVSRQTLNGWLKNAELKDDILHRVKRSLRIDLTIGKEENADCINKVTSENEPLGNSQNRDIGDFSFKDIKPINQHATYQRNSTFPEDKPPNELWQLIDNQQQQIRILMQQLNLVNNQIELMNKFLPKS